MNESIAKFLKKLTEDKELQAKVSAVATTDALYELAHAIQDGFTKEELLDALKSLAANANQDLDAADLAKTAGGLGVDGLASDSTIKITGESQSLTMLNTLIDVYDHLGHHF